VNILNADLGGCGFKFDRQFRVVKIFDCPLFIFDAEKLLNQHFILSDEQVFLKTRRFAVSNKFFVQVALKSGVGTDFGNEERVGQGVECIIQVFKLSLHHYDIGVGVALGDGIVDA